MTAVARVFATARAVGMDACSPVKSALKSIDVRKACCCTLHTIAAGGDFVPSTFKFDVKPRHSGSRTPLQELVYTYAKYGRQIIIVDPFNPFSIVDGSSSSSDPAPAATTSSAAPTETGSMDAASSSSDVAIVTTVTAIVSVTASSPSPATFTAPPASSATSASSVATSISAVQSATTSANGETAQVTASPEQNDSEYLSPVTIGGQALTLDFDTGSADLWVFSNSLPSSDSAGHVTFDPSKSPTFTPYSGATWQIAYGDGSSATGSVGFDSVTIGGVTVAHQAVELADNLSGAFVHVVDVLEGEGCGQRTGCEDGQDGECGGGVEHRCGGGMLVLLLDLSGLSYSYYNECEDGFVVVATTGVCVCECL
ncbi:hypothetical protein LTR82_014486 [Friedmanniomyces endolithicus]|uniref:Peptidase A1 domain-containing protein n=1 Tax=Friedmanniomyces endolithicus TaxID=329885 RepID=A0AAN6J7I8_9PEZI|nr:hypothetical protein LTR82_014486 [Friedmanniomyces endolithicus]